MPDVFFNLGGAVVPSYGDYPTAINKTALVWTNGSLQPVQDTGTLLKYANIMAPLDKPMSIKITNTRIPNVYTTLAKGQIPNRSQALNTSGQSVFVELTATASKLVDDGEILLPLACRIEFRLPNDGDITEEVAETLLKLTIGTLVDGSTNDLRVTRIMRGALAIDY